MVGSAVHCTTKEETLQVLNLYHSMGITYWPDDTFESHEAYLQEFTQYPYIHCRRYGRGEDKRLELVGNTKCYLGKYDTFKEFMSKCGVSKRQKILQALKYIK